MHLFALTAACWTKPACVWFFWKCRWSSIKKCWQGSLYSRFTYLVVLGLSTTSHGFSSAGNIGMTCQTSERSERWKPFICWWRPCESVKSWMEISLSLNPLTCIESPAEVGHRHSFKLIQAALMAVWLGVCWGCRFPDGNICRRCFGLKKTRPSSSWYAGYTVSAGSVSV